MQRLDSRLIWGCLVGLLGLGACGGVSRVDHAEGSAGGAGEANVCDQFKDEPARPALLTISNDTLAPVYFGSEMQTCGSPPLYEVHDASNAVLNEPGPCESRCQGWLDGNPFGGCPAACVRSVVTRLAPGESIVTHWSGLYVSSALLPKECNASPSAGTGLATCSVDKQVKPGSYTFYASASSDYACDDNPNGCGECVPAAAGGCTVLGGLVTGVEYTAQAVVDLDGGASSQTPSVELVFRRSL
jgi:hypothetical protein